MSLNILLQPNNLPPLFVGQEFTKSVNLSGAVTTGAATCKFRKIGNWVDIYVDYGLNSVGVTNTDSITLSSVLPVGYRPPTALAFIIEVVDTGVSPNVVTGNATIDTSGNIQIRRLGSVNWTSGANWGFNAFCFSFPIV